ncbi:uncharacterized protein LOC144523781 isoform X2 [Sander vitreus]
MAPPQQSNPTATPAVTFRIKPGKGEVKQVSVLTIRGPFSATIVRPANPQTNMPAKSIPVHGPQPVYSDVTTLAASRANSSGTTPTTKFSWAPSAVLGSGLCTTGVSHHHISAPPDPEEDTRLSSSLMI